MKVMLDTNVLISMILFPRERYTKMLQIITQDHTLILSSYIIQELMDVTDRKFPMRRRDVENFLRDLNYILVYTPQEMLENLFYIRDPNDYSVLYSAISADIDIFISGDKDFKEVNVKKPQVLTPTEFLVQYM